MATTTKLITCPTCNGSQGEYIAPDVMNACGECNGKGEIEVEADDCPQPIEAEVKMPSPMDLGPLPQYQPPKFY